MSKEDSKTVSAAKEECVRALWKAQEYLEEKLDPSNAMLYMEMAQMAAKKAASSMELSYEFRKGEGDQDELWTTRHFMGMMPVKLIGEGLEVTSLRVLMAATLYSLGEADITVTPVEGVNASEEDGA